MPLLCSTPRVSTILLDFILNHATLEGEIKDYVQDENLREIMDRETITEKSRDRMETRSAYTTSDIEWLFGKEKWENLCCIGAIKKEVEGEGKKQKSGTIIFPAGI